MYLHKTDHKYSNTHQHMTGAKKAAADFVTVPLQTFPTEKCFSCLPKTQNQKHRCYAVQPCDGCYTAQGEERRKEHRSGVTIGQQSPPHFAPSFLVKDWSQMQL